MSGGTRLSQASMKLSRIPGDFKVLRFFCAVSTEPSLELVLDGNPEDLAYVVAHG